MRFRKHGNRVQFIRNTYSPELGRGVTNMEHSFLAADKAAAVAALVMLDEDEQRDFIAWMRRHNLMEGANDD